MKKDAPPIPRTQNNWESEVSTHWEGDPPQTLHYQESKMICLRRDLVDSARLYLGIKRNSWPPELQAAFEKTIKQNRLTPVYESCIPLMTRKAADPGERDSFSSQRKAAQNPPKSTMERGIVIT